MQAFASLADTLRQTQERTNEALRVVGAQVGKQGNDLHAALQQQEWLLDAEIAVRRRQGMIDTKVVKQPAPFFQQGGRLAQLELQVFNVGQRAVR